MLVRKFFWLLRNRPAQLYGTVRGYLLFHWARMCRALFRLPGVHLGQNVRLQRNSSLMAESPDAAISIGTDSIIYEDASIEVYKRGKITIGSSSIIGAAKIVSRYRIQIGERFLSSWNVFIQDFDSHPTDKDLRKQQVENIVARFQPAFIVRSLAPEQPFLWEFPGAEIVIGDDVWVGAGATILKGAKIGSGSIVASGAVVLKGVYPDNSLIAGNPAKIVKNLGRAYSDISQPFSDLNHIST